MKRLARFMATTPTLTATDANVCVNRFDLCNSSRLRPTLSLRASALALGLLLASTAALAQTFRVSVVSGNCSIFDPNFPVSNGTDLTLARIAFGGSSPPAQVNFDNLTGGDDFGRLAARFGDVQGASSPPIELPLNTSGGSSFSLSGFSYLATWTGAGHYFASRRNAVDQGFSGGAVHYAEIRNAPMVTLSTGPSPTVPDLTPYLWGGSYIDPNVHSSIPLVWNSGVVAGDRALINFLQFGTFGSPHSDGLRVRTTLTIYKNNVFLWQDIDAGVAIWNPRDNIITKSIAGVGDNYTLDIDSTPNTQYCIELQVRVQHEAYYGGAVSYAGTRILYDETFRQCFTVLVPEPASMIALGSGLVGLLGLRRRKK